MLLLRYRGPILSLSFLVIAAVVIGCGSRREVEDDSYPGPMPSFGSGATTIDLGTAIKPGKATIKGRITLDGTPDLARLNEEYVATIQKLASPSDRPHCLNVGDHPEQKQEQDWKVGPGNGLGEVFVYLRPPQDSYFAVDPDDSRMQAITKKGPAIIDQPHCAYVPHVARLLPSFRDLKGNEEKNFQALEIENTAKIGHNVRFPGGNIPLSSDGGRIRIDFLKPEYMPLTISCTIHPWMNANILVLDHPYSAITNDKGEFEIKNAPEGKVRLIVWHGKSGFVTSNKARGEEVVLKKDEPLEKNFTVPYRQ